jgi:cobalt/nickel transport system permease protein
VRHSFLDELSSKDSLLRRRDPRAKIIVFFGCILYITATPAQGFHAFGLYAFMLVAFVIFAEIPVLYVLKRAAAAVPFILCMGMLAFLYPAGIEVWSVRIGPLTLVVTHLGLLLFWNTAVKAMLCVICMTLLVNTTPFSDLLKGFEKLKVPPVFIMIISFMYRYFFVLEDELEKMLLAKQARTVCLRRWPHIRALSNMLGVLFIRSYERAEAVYAAMRCRGFSGSIRTLHDFTWARQDTYFVAMMIIVLTSIWLTAV